MTASVLPIEAALPKPLASVSRGLGCARVVVVVQSVVVVEPPQGHSSSKPHGTSSHLQSGVPENPFVEHSGSSASGRRTASALSTQRVPASNAPDKMEHHRRAWRSGDGLTTLPKLVGILASYSLLRFSGASAFTVVSVLHVIAATHDCAGRRAGHPNVLTTPVYIRLPALPRLRVAPQTGIALHRGDSTTCLAYLRRERGIRCKDGYCNQRDNA